jgi:hypothetical protein
VQSDFRKCSDDKGGDAWTKVQDLVEDKVSEIKKTDPDFDGDNANTEVSMTNGCRIKKLYQFFCKNYIRNRMVLRQKIRQKIHFFMSFCPQFCK